jgi:glyoxylase-like metal-dependent hydrolase (beta-lactamase superfamily II)
MSMRYQVHTHASGEQGIYVNAYLVETANGVVAVDAALTVSESRTLRAKLDALRKPLLAALITHGHPDHVAGLANLIATADMPIVALASVERMMRAIETPKRAQWGPIYGEEWVPRWLYPNRLVSDQDTITFDGVTYRVHDFGRGGDCDANSIWTIETSPRVAFIGDLVFNGTHAYVADGGVLPWLANLERAKTLLADVATVYPGHGPAGASDLLARQQSYLLAYCAAVKELGRGRRNLTEEAKQALTARMQQFAPDAALGFLITHSADAVARELSAEVEQNDA